MEVLSFNTILLQGVLKIKCRHITNKAHACMMNKQQKTIVFQEVLEIDT